VSDYVFRRRELGEPWTVWRRGQEELVLGMVWREPRGWQAVRPGVIDLTANEVDAGERAPTSFPTRQEAADWLYGRWSVTEGPASHHIPADPFDGLPG
jgi:hypothetical protein